MFPSERKHAHVKPLHKRGDKSSSNYRPISLLLILSKTLEHVVSKQLAQHLTDNHLLYPLQSGFRIRHSTATAMLHCTNDWYAALDHNFLVGVFFLDVPKAFDTINHSLLVRKLSHWVLHHSAVSGWSPTWSTVHSLLSWATQYRIPLLFPPVCRRALSWVPRFSHCL